MVGGAILKYARRKLLRAVLILIRNYYVARIGEDFDLELSTKIDCLNYLIEN